MRFTPSWQFTLEDRLRADHQRRRQQQALRLMTVRTDGPGSDVYMGKRLELTTEKLRAYPVCADGLLEQMYGGSQTMAGIYSKWTRW
jgi:hypothetical protein